MKELPMPYKGMKKLLVAMIITVIAILLFMDKCTTLNLTTADIFRQKSLNDTLSLMAKPQSKHYEIVPLFGDFPVLYDSLKNEFYVSNKQGLAKYDHLGNLMFADDLAHEKYTSVFFFANFTPFVFAEHGVYDFSGNKLIYHKFSEVLNAKNEITDQDFKNIFEKYYQTADLVMYDSDRNIESHKETEPMYFRINDKWVLLFAQKNETRFSHTGSNEMEADTIGQIDFKDFPAKFANKRLMVLKDQKRGIYSTKQVGEKIDDDYLKMYYTQILKEQKLDYQTTDEVKLIAYKKEKYYFTGGYLDLPDWIAPSFINNAYFKLSYRNENIFFKEKAVKYFSDSKSKDDLYLYELPNHLKSKSKIAFLHYALDLGGFADESEDGVDPIIKNAGLYIVKQKK
ncbi:hypothetical protein [Pedobacter jamesrossensis]|uniref:DKNYY family protein n=1 Tax=Pedobacter jamesrossensis TaxID=1908238 RepID=A0ABV8NGB5_9SPHI